MTATAPCRPRVLLDVDSTVYPLLDAMRVLPGGENVSYDTVMSWDALPDACGGIPAMLDLFAAAMTPQAMSATAPFPGAARELRELARVADLHVCTDRPDTVAAATRDWLRAHRIPVAGMVCERKPDKLAVAADLGAALIIDDHPVLLDAAARAGRAICSLRWHYNAGVLDTHAIPHADDWSQLGPLARRLLAHA